VFPAIHSLGAFQEMATWHMRGLTPSVTLLWASVSQGGGKKTLTCNVANQRYRTGPPTQGSRIGMSRNVSILSVVAAMVALIVLGVVTMAFAEQGEVGS
jgi:hypothetical protein